MKQPAKGVYDRVNARWVVKATHEQALSRDKAHRRAWEKELGPLTSRQWVALRKQLRRLPD